MKAEKAPTVESQLLAAWQYRNNCFLKVEEFQPGSMGPEILYKRRITAALLANASMSIRKPLFFEPLSADEWVQRGLQLLAMDNYEPFPDGSFFCHAHSVISVLQRLLLDEAPGSDGVS
jgi:hypothetical protein